MSETATEAGERTAWWGVALAVALMLGFAMSPRSAAVMFAIASAGSLALHLRSSPRDRTGLAPSMPVAAVLAIAAFALMSTFWSADVRESLAKPLYLALVAAGAQALVLSFQRLGDDARRRLARSALVAIVVGLAFAAFEAATNQWLTRAAYTAFPRLYRGLEAHVQVQDGIVTFISETNIKRRVGGMTLLVWPAALAIVMLVPRPRRAAYLAALAALALLMIYVGPHQSSQLAGLVSGAIFLMGLRSRITALRLLAVGFAVVTFLALPLVWAAHKAELYKANWLPNSARHRIVIWNATAAEALKAPVLGVGANATRAIFEASEARTPSPPRDGPYIQGLTRHAHNAYVQIWYELGLVGAALLALAGIATLKAATWLPKTAQPFAAAQFAATAAVMSSSYGIWQMWFLATIAAGAAALCCAAAVPGQGVGDPQPTTPPRPQNPRSDTGEHQGA